MAKAVYDKQGWLRSSPVPEGWRSDLFHTEVRDPQRVAILASPGGLAQPPDTTHVVRVLVWVAILASPGGLAQRLLTCDCNAPIRRIRLRNARKVR